MSDGKLLKPEEALLVLSNELEEETAAANAYRQAAIDLIDSMADMAILAKREERKNRDKIVKVFVPPTSSIN